jgi:hypothetical protein
MGLRFMSGMVVIMTPMIVAVMIMGRIIRPMAVMVLMAMGVPVRMGVGFAVMGMVMAVSMFVFMGMGMFVSVQFYLHWDLLVCISLSIQAANKHLTHYYNNFFRQGKKKKITISFQALFFACTCRSKWYGYRHS